MRDLFCWYSRMLRVDLRATKKLLAPIIVHKVDIAIPGGLLRISSDGDDQMEPKVKTQKNP